MPPYADILLTTDDGNNSNSSLLGSSFCIHDEDQALAAKQQLHGVADTTSHTATAAMAPSFTKKSVRIDLNFNQKVLIESLDEYTDDELDAMWYSRFEYDVIREDILAQIERANHEILSNHKVGNLETFDNRDKYNTMHGLERFTYHQSLQRDCNKLRMLRTVLSEQERQRDLGGVGCPLDMELLGSVAAQCALVCRRQVLQAQALALVEQQPPVDNAEEGEYYYYYDEDEDEQEQEMLLATNQKCQHHSSSSSSLHSSSVHQRTALTLCYCLDNVFGLQCLKRWS